MKKNLIFLFMLISFGLQGQNNAEWVEEYQELESEFHYGKYYQCNLSIDALLKKMTKKNFYSEYLLPTQALKLKYQSALGMRQTNDSILNGLIKEWDLKSENYSDSIQIIGNLAFASSAYSFNKYGPALKLLDRAELKVNEQSDPDGFWNQKIKVAKMELYMKTMNFNLALKQIESSIAYQKDQTEVKKTKVNSRNGKVKEVKVKKKVYKERLNTLGYLNVLQADIYREKGNLITSDSLYQLNARKMNNWASKNDESYTYNLYGSTLLQLLEGDILAGTELKKIKNRYAKNIKFSIPNIQYNEMFQNELIADLELRNYSRHNKAIQQYQREITKNYSYKSVYQLESKRFLAMPDLYKGKIDSYDKKLSKIEEELSKYYDENDAGQIPFLYDLAKAKESNHAYETAEKIYLKIIDLYEKSNDSKSPLISKARLDLGSFYINHTTQTEKADSIFGLWYTEFVEQQLHPFNALYTHFLNDYALINLKSDQFSKAISKYEKLANIIESKYGNASEEYAIILEETARVRIYLGHYLKAEKNLLFANSTFKSLKITKSKDYVANLHALGDLYIINGDFINAERKLNEALSLANKLIVPDELMTINLIESLANLYITLGNYSIAENLLTEAKALKTQSFGKESIHLVSTNRLFSQLYLHQGRLIDSEKSIQKALKVSSFHYGINSLSYIENQSALAEIYFQMGNFHRALTLTNQVFSSYEKKFGPNYLGIADDIILKTKIELALNFEEEKLLQNLNRATQIISDNVNDRHPKVGEVVELKALILLKQDKIKEALIQFQGANLIFTSTYGTNHPKTADNQVNVATLFFQSGNYVNALAYYEKALPIYEKLFDTNHPKYIYTLSKIGRTYYAQKNYSDALNTLGATTKMYLKFINNNFPALSSFEKERYWNKISTDFDIFNSLAIDFYTTDPSILSDMFNNRLATKSLLLRSAQTIHNQIMNYGSPNEVLLLEELQSKSDSLIWAQCYSMDELDSMNYNIQETKEVINRWEKQLSEIAYSSNQNFDSKESTWVSVKNKLNSNEAIIEIIRVNYFNTQFTDSIIYVALIAKKETKNIPEIVLLTNGNDLEGKYFSYYQNTIKQRLNDTKSYAHFWEYLDAHLQSKNTLYLSADGVFNQLNPETFKTPKGNYLLENYTFYNISNIRELETKSVNPSSTFTTAALFGNPSFSMGMPYSKSNSQPLPGAEKEVGKIGALLSNQEWSTSLFIGDNATETNVKNLDNPRILHLATHGYFRGVENEIQQTELLGYENLRVNPLLRSGLLFAGADSILELNDVTKFNRTDGVLTALEAMNLNLNTTELVFLSACETGRGDIQAGNDVFGLQQAFQAAGAKNVIMTLFKVDDKITQELVEEFYSSWLTSGNKRLAFVNAKKAILKKYKDPIYWGSFVIIGLD